MRTIWLTLALAFAGSVVPLAAEAVISRYQLNIPRQSLDAALKDFAQQTGLQIARFTDVGDGSALVGPITGDYSAEDALTTLLAPSGLPISGLDHWRHLAVRLALHFPTGSRGGRQLCPCRLQRRDQEQQTQTNPSQLQFCRLRTH